MTVRIRRIAVRFTLLLALAAVVPLIAYGAVSLLSLQRGTRQSIIAGNLIVATRAAEEIRRYVAGNAHILDALAANLHETGLTLDQQDRILKNYILQFREFREITLFDEQGASIASSHIGPPRVRIPSTRGVMLDDVSMSPIRVDADLLPTAVFAIHLKQLGQPAGWLVGELNLEEMWRMVDRIRIGEHGYALVVAPDGRLVAHGDPDKNALVAEMKNVGAHPLVAAARAAGDDVPVSREYADEDNRRQLGVAARIPSLGWTVIVEQPTREAYATAAQLERQLAAAIAAALVVMIGFGYFFGRSFIDPILELKRATGEVASGNLSARVAIDTGDEFADLGESFNAMADRLVELQEDVKRKERQAMFGRVAAGLVHDLAHPIQNIGNSTRLLLRDDLDPEERAGFHRTIDRELAMLKRFMEDLRHVVKPKPIERFPLDVNVAVAEVFDGLRAEGERAGIAVEAIYSSADATIDADRFALGRVFRNLMVNAIQATPPGGRVTIETTHLGSAVEVRVTDTGSGIPAERLPTIFDEYVTTKRRGLGLGLAITKRIVEQHEGTITVESELGRGTSFTLRFPATEPAAARAVAAG